MRIALVAGDPVWRGIAYGCVFTVSMFSTLIFLVDAPLYLVVKDW